MPKLNTCPCCRGYMDYATAQFEALDWAADVRLGSTYQLGAGGDTPAALYRCRDCALKCHHSGPCYYNRRNQVTHA